MPLRPLNHDNPVRFVNYVTNLDVGRRDLAPELLGLPRRIPRPADAPAQDPAQTWACSAGCIRR